MYLKSEIPIDLNYSNRSKLFDSLANNPNTTNFKGRLWEHFIYIRQKILLKTFNLIFKFLEKTKTWKPKVTKIPSSWVAGIPPALPCHMMQSDQGTTRRGGTVPSWDRTPYRYTTKYTTKSITFPHPKSGNYVQLLSPACVVRREDIGVFSKCFHWIRWIQWQIKI